MIFFGLYLKLEKSYRVTISLEGFEDLLEGVLKIRYNFLHGEIFEFP
jgi:hypothetical protein